MTTADSTRLAYDTLADAYADHITGTSAEQPLELAMLAHFVDLLAEPRRVLDAGCGAGRLLPHLAGLGCLVEGVDLSAEMVRRAHADHPGFDVEVASLDALPHPDATFDGVVCWYSTIHHRDDALGAVIAELRRVLRPGGLLLLAFQAGEGVVDAGASYRAIGLAVDLTRHRRTIDTWTRLLADQGLQIVATMQRSPVGRERDDQAVVIAKLGERPGRAD